jgi:hypothetical protein
MSYAGGRRTGARPSDPGFLVRAPGLRADRPLTVEEDLEVSPGEPEVRVASRPQGAPGGA